MALALAACSPGTRIPDSGGLSVVTVDSVNDVRCYTAVTYGGSSISCVQVHHQQHEDAP